MLIRGNQTENNRHADLAWCYARELKSNIVFARPSQWKMEHLRTFIQMNCVWCLKWLYVYEVTTASLTGAVMTTRCGDVKVSAQIWPAGTWRRYSLRRRCQTSDESTAVTSWRVSRRSFFLSIHHSVTSFWHVSARRWLSSGEIKSSGCCYSFLLVNNEVRKVSIGFV